MQSSPAPQRLRLISHGSPGSGPDRLLGALAAAILEASAGTKPAVEHLPGGDGADAIMALAAAAGDGSVAASCTPTYLTTPVKRHLAVRYSDLTPLGRLVADTYLLAVRRDAPWQDVREMLAAGAVCAAAPRGGNTHIQSMLLHDATGLNAPVHYYQSIQEATAAVADGEAGWTTGVVSDFADGLLAGRLRILANFGSGDDPNAAGVSLIAQGIEVTFPLWRGLIGPGGLSAEDVAAWEARLRGACATAAWAQYLAGQRLRGALTSAADFRAELDGEAPRYEAWLRQIESDSARR